MAVGARSGSEGPEEPGGHGDSPMTTKDPAPSKPPQGVPEQPPAAGSPAGGTAEDGTGGRNKDEVKKARPFWKELPLLIGIALVLALVIKTFLVQAFSIPSDSMQDTLQRGDRVLVDKLTPWFGSEPQRGEVVVFHDPGGWLPETPVAPPNPVQRVLSFVGLMPSAEEKDLIKRVIAVGGDTVECKGTGPVKVNGRALVENSYLYPGNTPCGDRPFGPIHVPQGRIWVMGDHRQDSLDSRYHTQMEGGGTVDVDQVVGRAFTVAWPVNRWDFLGVPDTFDQSGIDKALPAAPAVLGLAGAAPLVLWRRRRLTAGLRGPSRDTSVGEPETRPQP
ncbi:signal peptidase I [Streptomyces sp. NPDC059740]|uniref:signal peptidase I n=1 Tax=Streptomyces sp. NPDC059740 TaxID=3346926 RepID=UPI003659CB90